MDKDTVVRQNATLLWSGNNPPYDLFRSSDCTNVTTTPPLTTLSGNSYAETSAPMVNLLCYQVFATAPGPGPPPGAGE